MNVMIMATIMGKQRASDACTLFHLDKPQMGSQPRRLSSLAGAVSTLGCLSNQRINDKHRMVYKVEGNILLFCPAQRNALPWHLA